MAMKPQVLANLTPGKLIDTFTGFVDTFNWLVSCIQNLKGEGGIKVKGLDEGQPIITGAGGAAIKVTGTDGVEVEGSSLVFASASDSNVEIKATVDDEGVITCTVGVYWWRGNV